MTACSSSAPTPDKPTDTTPVSTGFKLLRDIDISKFESIISLDVIDNLLLIFDYSSEDEENYSYRLTICNIKWNIKIAVKILEPEIITEGDIGAEFKDKKTIALFNRWDNTAILYDLNLNIIEKDVKYVANDYIDYDKFYDEKKKEIPYSDDDFIFYDNYATYNMGDYCALIFYNDSNRIYLRNLDDYESRINEYENNILICREEKELITFEVTDYQNNIITHTAEIPLETPTEDNMIRVLYDTAFTEKYIVVPIIDNNGNLEAIYFWKYASEKQDSKPTDIKTIEYDKISENIKQATDNLKKSFSVDVVINPDNIDDDKPLVKEKCDLKIYFSLLYTYDVYSLFPDGMIQEMYNYPDGFDKLCVYYCRYIDDDFSAAYHSNINGVNYVVYTTTNLNLNNIVHELMHASEYRIWHYNSDKFDLEWEKLNPDNFEYVSYDHYMDYDESDNIEYYFARDYGRSSMIEDHAVTFEALFSYGNGERELEWKKDSPIYKKAELLCKSLRASYPSVKNCDDVIWEKFFNE